MQPNDEHEAERILEKGIATQDQIDEAINIREKMSEMGMQPRSIAEVLFEKGYIESEAFEEIRREDRRVEGKEQIAGYRLLEKLGEGAMGSVYKARQLSLDRDVAIKVLSPNLGDNEEYVQRFFTEARAVARLNHTNIISGIDVGESGGIKYLVMEYADGMTVASLLRRGGAMDEERVLWIGLQIARALDHAHRNGLIHRDVKPDNIIITNDGVAKLCDLGLARMESEGEESKRMGTAAYISPEQARGDSDITERADLYSLGATLFHMLTGREPYEGADASAVLAKHLTEPVPSPRSADGTLHSRTERIVTTLMAKDPGERTPSAKDLVGELEKDLREMKTERGVAAGPPSSVAAPAKPAPATPAPAAPAPKRAPGGAAPVRRRKRRR